MVVYYYTKSVQKHMKMETKDCNSPSGKKSQTSNPPATLRNQVVAEARILEASPNSCSPTEKSVEDRLSTSVENLHPVSTARSAKKDSTATPLMRGTRNLTMAGRSVTLLPNSSKIRGMKARQKETSAGKEKGLQTCLSEPSPPPVPGKTEEREAGNVDATGLTPVCENRSMQPGLREPGRASSRRQRKALRKKAKFLGNEDMDVATPPSVAISREIGRKKAEGEIHTERSRLFS